MLKKICTCLHYNYSYKTAPILAFKQRLEDDFKFARDNYLRSTDRFAGEISTQNGYHYQYQCDDRNGNRVYVENYNDENISLAKEDMRLWEFNDFKIVDKLSKHLGLTANPIKLSPKVDGYYLGTLQLNMKYAIFCCFHLKDFENISREFLTSDVYPIVFSFDMNMQKSNSLEFIRKRNGYHFHIEEVVSLNKNRGFEYKDIKNLLQFRGKKQKEVFNIGDLKHNLANPTWGDLTITIIDKEKININIGSCSKTFRCSDIPFFYNKRTKEPKACWETLFSFYYKEILYDNNLRNRLSELRLFFKKFKINGDPFVVEQDVDFKGKKLEKVKQSYVRSAFKVKIGGGDYKPYK